jgi:ABC-2 type transport system permease protein
MSSATAAAPGLVERHTPIARVDRDAPTGGARVVARLYARLIRRSVLLLVASMAAYLAVEVLAFQAAYPDAASRAALMKMADNAAVRMLQGVPHGIDDTGAYVVWDAGWMIQSIVAIWALVVTTRLLRGEEDSDRVALVLTAPVSAARAVTAQLLVLAGAAALVGSACATALLLVGTAPAGALLYGAGVAGFAATFIGVAAVAAQLAPTRRRALGGGAAVLGAAYLVRMVASSTDARASLHWLTPYGWVDDLRPYDANRPWALAALLAAAVAFSGLAVHLRARRDTGASTLGGREHGRSRMGLLGGPIGLAWRLNLGVLLGWVTGVALYAAMIGALAPVVTDLTREDPDYQKTLEQFGMGMALTERGFVAFMGPTMALMIALYVCWRVGAARSEEAAGHLETMLAQPVTRRQRLTGHAGLALAGAGALTVGAGLATWLGAQLAGAEVSLGDAFVPVAAQAPLVLAFAGVAVLMFGLMPRLTTTLPAAIVVIAYLLQMLGPGVGLPDWLIAVSPFHHLGYVPIEPFREVPTLMLVAVGAAAATAGGAAFARRDLAGG